MKTKRSLLTSCISLLLCFAMLLGTTFAWFTDVAVSSGNKIQSGTLKIDLLVLGEDDGHWKSVKDNKDPIFNYDKWEPGYTDITIFKVVNLGTLSLKWEARFASEEELSKLAEVIDVYVCPGIAEAYPTERVLGSEWENVGTLDKFINTIAETTHGFLDAGESDTLGIALKMQEDAGNEYQGLTLGEFDIHVVATQANGESDSFGNEYDKDAKWPDIANGFVATKSLDDVATVYGELANDLVIRYSDSVYALLPAGVKLADGVSTLKFSGKATENGSNIVLGEGDTAESYDIHIEGIADDNTTPITVYLGEILKPGISDTSLKLYHESDLMTRVNSVADFAINNQYTYDSATGELVIYVDNFSVFSYVETTADEWDGNSDTAWYNENDIEFTLSTAEQLAGFRDLVDGGNTFAGKNVKLGADIDLANKLFDPIGYDYEHLGGKVFMGTFDGAGHTIYNLYQNGWELGYSYGTQGAGLFASIKDATIKNLAISGANIVFECVDMGTVVGYAQGTCHFENIVVTNSKLANYQRYTGGVVGEVSHGPYGTDISSGYSHTFNNIVVDSSVKISSLWGDFDNACGGIIGGKWGDATVKMENVISACEIDAFSDVTAAYQWYAYRRCGMLIGHTEQNSPKKALNAAAEFLTCENVEVYYGDWVNYTYYEYENQDNATGRRYPWVRAEAGAHNAAFSNPRYGVPTHGGDKVTGLENSTDYTPIVFNQLYGGGQGVYGCNEHVGVNIINSLENVKTVYISNNESWENLKLQCWFKNGEDTWSTNIDGISMDGMETAVAGIYKVTLPTYVSEFKITADGENAAVFTLADLKNNFTYNLDGASVSAASVNGNAYATLEEAIANANGGTVTLESDVVIEESIVIDGISTTINLNGKTISVANNAEIVEVLLVKNNANVVITGNGTMLAIGEGDDVEHVEVISAIDGAKVKIENGTFISEGCTAVYATRGAIVSIYGGTFDATTTYDGRYFTLDVNEAEANRGEIIVYGGTYVNFDPANHTTDGIDYKNKLANTCFKSNYNESEKTYTVVADHTFVDGECDCGVEQKITWELLTDTSDLKVGDIIVFVYENDTVKYEMSSIDNKIGKYESYTITPKGLMIFEVVSGAKDNTVAFKNGDNYIKAISDNKIELSVSVAEDSSWNVTIENGKAVVKNVSLTDRFLQFNNTSGQERFCCYKNTQHSVGIYVQKTIIVCAECTMIETARQDATCTEAGYVTEKCSVCNNEVTTPIDALGHDYTGENPYVCVNNCGTHNLPETGSIITIQQALWIAETLKNGEDTANKYIITGVIDDEDHPSSTGATTITADAYSIYITNIHNVDGTIRHDAFTTKLQNGDSITVSAKIAKNESGEVQLHETWLADHTDSPSDNICDICGQTIGGSTEPDPEPETPTNPTWTKVDIADIKSTDVIVIVWTTSNGTSYAITNDKGTASAPSATIVTVIGEQLSGDITDNIKWNISNDNGNLTIYPNGTTGTWLYCTNTNNGVRVGTNTNKTFTIDANSGYLKHTGTSRYLGVYTTNPDVRCYTSSTAANITNQTIAFYKLVDGTSGGETPDPEPSCEHTNTIKTTVDATCTEPGSVTVTCDDCGETVSTEEIAALGHTTENGTCEICGEVIGGTSEPTEPTVVLEITKDDFNSTSYAANNNTKTENEYSYTSYQVMNQSSVMQWQKSKGYITIASNEFVKLELKVTAGTYTVTVGGEIVTGTTSNGVTTYDLTGLSGEIKISVGGETGKVDYLKFYK